MQSLKKMLSKVGSKKEIVKAETGSDTVGVVPTVGASRSPSPSVSHVVSAGPPPSPGTLRAAAPPSSVGSNSLPPGVKVMHGPPPPGAKMMVGPPSAGHISPERSIGSPPPPGAKVMVGAPPPGVKVMHGPPPPGAKIMAGPPPSSSNFVPPSGSAGRLTPERSMPPGVKVMHGPPPPGMIVRKGPPPPGATLTAAPSGSVVVSPERSRALSSSPPPGVKVMHGPPPPGAKIMAGPPPSSGTFVAPSGSAGRISPERSLPPGVKVMHGAPPPGAKIMKAPPGSSPPGLSPERSITPPGAKMVMKGPPPPGAKLVSGPPSPQRNPTPPRTSTSGVPPLIGSPQKSVVSPAGRVSPPLVPQRLSGQASSELNFTVEPPATSPPKSVPTKVPLHAPGTSPKTPQPATTSTTPAAPSPRGSSGGAGNLAVPHFSPPAPKNTSDAEEIELHSDRSSSLPFQVEPTPPATAAAPSGTPPVAPTSSRQAAATGQDSSTASFTVEVDGDALTQKPLKQASLMVGVASTSSFKTADPPAVGAAAKAAPAPVRIDARKEAEEATFPASQLHLTNLTSALRSRIVEQFFSVLCPQQYFGKMNKISKIKPIQSDRAIATGLTGNNSIFVCTKGSNPNRHFFPQLRLLESDAVRSNGTAREVAQVDTPVILYEAAPGNMLFADTELEGLRLLQAHQFSNSCFILASSSILFKEPEKYVLPLATLNLRWTPYASAASEPRCPIHNTELQLFDPYTKELACALCETKNEKSGNLVVIPDVLRPDSRRQILESLSHQLDEAQQSAKNWIGQHKRIAQLQENRKIAINQQFDLLLSAMESKRREFMEACDAEYGYAASEVARQVLVSDEKIHLLQAADHHCRMDVSRPLYSMQIATVAEGLAAGTQFPDTFSKNSLSVPGLSSGITPRLDGVMAELQSLTPYLFAAQTEDVRRTVNGGSRSPYNTGGTRSAAHRRRAVATGVGGQSPHSKIVHNESSINTEKLRHVSPIRSVSANRRRPTPTSTNVAPRAASALHSRGILSHNAANNNIVTPRANQPPRRQNGAAMDTLCRAVETIESHTALRGARDAAPQARSWGPRGSLPNGFGTSLFDHCLNELLVRGAAGEEPRPGVGRPMRPKSVVVQWAVEVLDAGDWVGLGVGVGCSIEEWERGRANDLSHLWIVPYGGINKTFLLRVVAPSGSTRARLTVHDAKGKQLSEEGSIPQWNVGRPAYPQITFGGRVGEVQMVEEPHIIAA